MYIVDVNTEKHYYYNIKKSEYKLNEGWFDFGSGKEGIFYNLGNAKNDFTSNADFAMIQMDFLIDPQINQFIRKSTGLFEIFGTIGGIFEILQISVGIFISFYSRATFRQSILSALRKRKKLES